VLVATERLGRPKRSGGNVVQTKLEYPTDSDTPTATCHVLPSAEEAALCGYPWEALVEVPGCPEFLALSADLRCAKCERVIRDIA